MRDSFKMTKKSSFALIVAIAVFGVASPAFAQSYSFPTYAYTHPGAGPGSAALASAPKARLYNAAAPANTLRAIDPSAWGSAAAHGNSH